MELSEARAENSVLNYFGSETLHLAAYLLPGFVEKSEKVILKSMM